MNASACLTTTVFAFTVALCDADTDVYDLAKGTVGKGSPWTGDDAKLRLSPGKAGRLNFRLPTLPAHEFLKISADVEISSPFFRVNEQGSESTDRLQIETADGKTLLDSSFSSNDLGQSYPDRYGSFVHKGGTGATGGKNIYTVELSFPHIADSLDLNFRWRKAEALPDNAGFAIQINGLNMGGVDSAYTITGLKVTALDKPPTTLDHTKSSALLETISREDPIAARDALNALIGAGETVIPFIRQRFTVAPDPDLEAKIATLTTGLRSDDFKERSNAEAALGELGSDALPHISALLAGREKLTADVRSGLEVVKARLGKAAEASPDQILANRLRTVLDLLASDAAKAVEKLLPPVRNVELYSSPEDAGDAVRVQIGGKLKLDLKGGDE